MSLHCGDYTELLEAQKCTFRCCCRGTIGYINIYDPFVLLKVCSNERNINTD